MLAELEETYDEAELYDPESTSFDKCYVRCGIGNLNLKSSSKESSNCLREHDL